MSCASALMEFFRYCTFKTITNGRSNVCVLLETETFGSAADLQYSRYCANCYDYSARKQRLDESRVLPPHEIERRCVDEYLCRWVAMLCDGSCEALESDAKRHTDGK